jgi:hypothetical protein
MGMTAARKLSPAISDDDLLWKKFLAAPIDPNPAPEQETLGLQQTNLGGFVDGATVSAEITRRAQREAKGPRRAR